MRRVVFDTNILLSAQIWGGKPYGCLELARRGEVQGVTCREIILELEEKLHAKFRHSDERIAETLADLLGLLHPVAITGDLRVVPADPDDDKVVECAVVAGATHIVTGDRRHLLPIGQYQGVKIVTAAEFLAELAAK